MPICNGFLTLPVPSHVTMALMTDNPKNPVSPPRQPLVLPANCRDVTAEKIDTVIGIVGATAAKATKPG